MKTCSSNGLVKLFLISLWVTAQVDARTWRRPTARFASIRGGSAGDDLIPIVPESVTASNVLPRGGSVTATKKPKLTTSSSSSVVTGTRSVHVVAASGAATTLPAIVETTEPVVLNATITATPSLTNDTQVATVEKHTTAVHHHKRHKWIAKKLKVSRAMAKEVPVIDTQS